MIIDWYYWLILCYIKLDPSCIDYLEEIKIGLCLISDNYLSKIGLAQGIFGPQKLELYLITACHEFKE